MQKFPRAKTGDPLRIPASSWNGAMEAAEAHARDRIPSGAGPDERSGWDRIIIKASPTKDGSNYRWTYTARRCARTGPFDYSELTGEPTFKAYNLLEADNDNGSGETLSGMPVDEQMSAVLPIEEGTKTWAIRTRATDGTIAYEFAIPNCPDIDCTGDGGTNATPPATPTGLLQGAGRGHRREREPAGRRVRSIHPAAAERPDQLRSDRRRRRVCDVQLDGARGQRGLLPNLLQRHLRRPVHARRGQHRRHGRQRHASARDALLRLPGGSRRHRVSRQQRRPGGGAVTRATSPVLQISVPPPRHSARTGDVPAPGRPVTLPTGSDATAAKETAPGAILPPRWPPVPAGPAGFRFWPDVAPTLRHPVRGNEKARHRGGPDRRENPNKTGLLWERLDSNQRRQSHLIYSQARLSTSVHSRFRAAILRRARGKSTRSTGRHAALVGTPDRGGRFGCAPGPMHVQTGWAPAGSDGEPVDWDADAAGSARDLAGMERKDVESGRKDVGKRQVVVVSGNADVALAKADVMLRDLDVASRLSDVGLPNSDIHFGQTDILSARTDILPRPISSRNRRLRAGKTHHACRRRLEDRRSAITGGGTLKPRIGSFDQTEVAR